MRRIPFSSFESFSPLFRDYIEHPERLAPYFNGDFRRDADLKQRAAEAAAAHPNRDRLVAMLRGQAATWGLSESSESLIARLEDPASSVVVTGQQLGLAGGPLYTLYKTLSTVQLAAHIESLTGKPCVPVFWLEGEDHDFDEVAWTGMFDGDAAVRVRYEPAVPSGGRSIGRLEFSDEIAATIDRMEALLQPTDFRDGLMATLRSAYRPGRTFIQAFVETMNAMLGPGRVVFVSPDDMALKSLGDHVFEYEINDWRGALRRLEETSTALGRTHHVQVTASATNLFLHEESGRQAVDATNNGLEIRGGRAVTEAELTDLLAADPGRFSPNVVLRPLLQDAVLPTAAYVAGPGEIAYFAQFKSLYEWAHLPMPIIYPRASITLAERRIEKIVERYELDIPDFEDQVDRLFRRVVLDQMEIDLDAAFKDAGAHIHEAVNAIKPVVESVDRSLVKASEAVRASYMKEWAKLKDRVVKAERSQHDLVREQLERAMGSLVPSGSLQERFVSPVYFMNKYGPNLADRLLEQMDLDTTSHQVITL